MAELQSSTHELPTLPPGQHGHETRDWNFRLIVGFGVGLLIVLIVVFAALSGLFTYLGTHDAKSDTLPSMVTPQLPPEPRLQVESGDQLKALRATEDALLTTYGWVDSSHDIVRIPIQRAMEILATQGLPTATMPTPNGATPTPTSWLIVRKGG